MPDIHALLWPRHVALIGASADLESLRGRIMHTMTGHPFQGPIYPVTRSHAEVMGRRAYASIHDLPEAPQLAVLIIPAQYIPQELERCGRAGVKAAVVLSSGFAEAGGADGSLLQADIRRIAERYDMAVIGPNAEGFANIVAALCPTFSPALEPTEPLPPTPTRRGQVTVLAQSGGIGFSFFDHGRAKELAFRYIVTTGNEACLEIMDIAEYALDEGKTEALIVLLEDVKNPHTLRRVAEKALRAGIPIITAKIGRSEAGVRAAASHTAALAGSYQAYRAMFDRYGIIEGHDIDEMLDLASAMIAWRGRLPAGRRVAICTASGGGGGWMADACTAAGLEVPILDADTRARIDPHLPAYGTSQNPVDATAQAVHKIGYAGLARLVMDAPGIDGLIVVITARSPKNLAKQQAELARLAREASKPILLWSYTLPAPQSTKILSEAGYPLSTDIRNCARAFAAMADYSALRSAFLKPIEVVSTPEPARATARARLAEADGVLCEWETRPVLAAYGVGTLPAARLVDGPAAAVEAAVAIGAPVALKIQSPEILHKTEAGGVKLNLARPDQVGPAYTALISAAKAHAPSARIRGVLVQAMAPPGLEMILGIKRDATFGPLLLVGLGGVNVERFKDVVVAPVPLVPNAARGLLERLKGAGLLKAYRGRPASDVDALVDAMVRLAALAHDFAAEIAEIDLNPVIVHAQGNGLSVVDALLVKQQA
ncbi:MAG TPA: acetate--CoA ligase family protein [Hyphomicrobiaceae bacterium]|nr:acetate--CoA ligase family protein [Hyphomicrobiaceae bacterium]